MSKRRLGWIAIVMLVAVSSAAPPAGAEQETADPMAVMMKYAQPGDHHQHMAKLVGKWKAKGKFWMAPGAPPTESDGTAEIRAVLGGRFFQTDYTGDFMGQTFHGMGLDGYDNYSKKHIGTWVDTMGTMMLTYEGSCEDGGRVVTVWSEFDDPMSGQHVKMKQITTRVDENTLRFEAFIEMPGLAAPMKAMEIVYSRV